MKLVTIFIRVFLLTTFSCTHKPKFSADFNNVNDQIWVGKYFWSIPLEGWNLPGNAGFILGVFDQEDPGVHAACYFGKGIKAGISLNGFAFLGEAKTDLPEGFDYSEVLISLSGSASSLIIKVADKTGKEQQLLSWDVDTQLSRNWACPPTEPLWPTFKTNTAHQVFARFREIHS